MCAYKLLNFVCVLLAEVTAKQETSINQQKELTAPGGTKNY
jgi:hypothetical protein